MSDKKVVIVDDDESIRKTFFMILNESYRVYLAQDPHEALRRFGDAKIDLIIADLKLPDLNGLEMISKFREKGYKGDVIMISAYPDLVHPEELSKLSISHFFVKPLDLKALDHSINYLLNTENENERRI